MSLGKRSTGPSIRAARRAWYERSKRGLHSHALAERSSGLTTGFRAYDGICEGIERTALVQLARPAHKR